MFEKDLYALIRGLRNHKGNEKGYIDDSIRECRKEIKGPDMDQKATALLKLVYLEMFGHDMSWASFHVLEVMSSAKYLQKRVGYLGMVQSFRPDTEVLMLGENLLKKDLTSPHLTTISLTLSTIPHVVNPSMANSLLVDLLPRLSHSSPIIRKKTIATLYRLALVFPETLRPTWPKIKERLLDENEDPSVTAAIVNVICELGWRRPGDFLPLAPRLFELLVNGGNNWMAIKIVKLFAVLTPLEPRLIKKLLPPLTTLIKTTPAMSLLYECINGILQGGILDSSEGSIEGDEIARLCVGKLRGMLVVEGDPNLKYVALLAMSRIVNSHSALVSEHADVIIDCVDDLDISIRTRALDLMVGMVDPNNLVQTVERLLRQLRESAPVDAKNMSNDGSAVIRLSAELEDDAAMEESLKRHEVRTDQPPPLPDEYRRGVLQHILDMCSRDTYSNINDFDWYIGVLVELVRHCPASSSGSSGGVQDTGVAAAIGDELQNVAVRVKTVRPEATAAAQSLLMIERRRDMFPASGAAGLEVLGSAAWIAGEYANLLPDPDGALTALTHTTSLTLSVTVLSLYLQAIPKVFARLVSHSRESFTHARKAHTSLLTARIVHFLEQLVLHADLDVQERAVEFLELARLAAEATTAYIVPPDGEYSEGPLLLTQALPALFSGQELNPVAAAALARVPQDEELDLAQPISDDLQALLSQADLDMDAGEDDDEIFRLYHDKPAVPVLQVSAAADTLSLPAQVRSHHRPESRSMDAAEMEKLKAERKERYQNDPFYIDPQALSGRSTPFSGALKTSNGDDLNVDDIPVLELQLDTKETLSDRERGTERRMPAKPRRRVEITADETLGGDDLSRSLSLPSQLSASKRSPLEVDSSGLSKLSLSEEYDNGHISHLEYEQRQVEEDEMAKAMKEVERLRLEMQRAQERVEGPEAGTVVKRKKKKKPREQPLGDDLNGLEEGDIPTTDRRKPKSKKKKSAVGLVPDGQDPGVEEAGEGTKVKKKKRRVVLDEVNV